VGAKYTEVRAGCEIGIFGNTAQAEPMPMKRELARKKMKRGQKSKLMEGYVGSVQLDNHVDNQKLKTST
jgi:predicted GIY-YIG superfamily endonuclease